MVSDETKTGNDGGTLVYLKQNADNIAYFTWWLWKIIHLEVPSFYLEGTELDTRCKIMGISCVDLSDPYH